MSDQEQSLTDHLTELRQRVVASLYGVIFAFIGCFIFQDRIVEFVKVPITPYLKDGKFVSTEVMGIFLPYLKVSLFAAIIVSCPWWIYQAWKFIAPGLYQSEKKYSIGFIFSGSFLFLSGVSFVYYVVYPMAFKFLIIYAPDQVAPMITLSDYLSFFSTTAIVFGLAFNLPLFLTMLGLIGIVDKATLVSKRRYAIVILAVTSAMITPPDAISMLMLMGPLYLLFEIGVFMVGVFEAKGEQQS